MPNNDVLFSVHDYDQDGDVHEEGIYLHFGATRIKVANNLKEFEEFVKCISGMVDEIRDNYPLTSESQSAMVMQEVEMTKNPILGVEPITQPTGKIFNWTDPTIYVIAFTYLQCGNGYDDDGSSHVVIETLGYIKEEDDAKEYCNIMNEKSDGKNYYYKVMNSLEKIR